MIMGPVGGRSGAFEIDVVLVSCKLNIENQLSPDGLRQPGPLGGWGEGSHATDFRCNLRKQDDMV